LRREVRSLRPPLLFDEGICCLAGFSGETGHSGYNLGFDGRGRRREV
jgi:hypothetical protein